MTRRRAVSLLLFTSCALASANLVQPAGAAHLSGSVQNPRGEARALHDLAQLAHRQLDYSKAEELYLGALNVLSQSEGEDRFSRAAILNNLGLLYGSLAASEAATDQDARFRQAEESFLGSLALKTQELASSDPGLLQTKVNLADLYRTQGAFGDAEPLYHEVLEAGSQTSDPVTISVLMGLIEIYQAQGRDSDALPLVDRVAQMLTHTTSQGWATLGSIASALPAPEEPQASLLNLSDWTLRSTYDSSLVPMLPLKGVRTFDELALLSPGVFRVPSTSGKGPAVGLGVGTAGQFSVNGFRGRSNNFTIDGSDNNDADIGVRRQGFVSRVPQTIDTVQDFQIQTAGFQTEFGRNAGSQVNVVSRSGSTRFHGSVYGLFEDDALMSQGHFDHPFSDAVNVGDQSGGGFPGEDFNRYQVGGTAGFDAFSEKVFFFVSSEYQKQSGSSLGHFVVPGLQERGLRINPRLDSDGDGFVPVQDLGEFFTSRNIPYGDSVGKGIFSLYPLPNNSGGPFGANTYSQAKPNSGEGLVLSGKVDWYVTGGSVFTARYNLTNDNSVLPFTGDSVHSSLATETRTQNISTYLNTIRTRSGNMIRASYGRTRLDFPADKGSPLLFGSSPEHSAGVTEIIQTPYGSFGPFGSTGPIGQLQIVPFSPIGIDVFNFPQGRVDNTFQVSDSFSWLGESHGLKVGFDFRYYQLNSFSDRNSRPKVVFGQGVISGSCRSNPFCLFSTEDGLLHGTDSAALGAAAGVLQALSTQAVPDTTIGLRFSELDLYVHDDWRVRNNLVLNLGLRYELHSVPREVNGRIEETFNLSASDFGHLNPEDFNDLNDRRVVEAGNQAFDAAVDGWMTFLDGRERIYSSDRNNFAPRVGFAWDPWGTGRMVLRGGYGLYYDSNLGAVTSQSRNVFPTFVPVNLDPNFNPPTGELLNSPFFARFTPTDESLIRPGTLNTYDLSSESFATGLGTLFRQAPPIPGASLSGNGLAFTLPEKNFPTSYGQHFLLSLQAQFSDFWGSVGYVGTRGSHLVRFTTPNAGMISTPVLLFPAPQPRPLLVLDIPPTVSPSSLGRPDSSLGAYRVFQNSANSSYHSLQVEVGKRLSRGLQFRGSWVWSHAIDEVSDPFESRGFFSLPQDTTRFDLERASASFDIRHRVTGFLFWNFPDSVWGGVFKDFTVAAIGELQGGQPFTVNTSFDRNLDGNLTDRLDDLGGISVQTDSDWSLHLDPNQSFGELLAPTGHNGQVGRNTFRSDGIASVDVAVSRRFRFEKATSLDLRVEIFNLFNSKSFGIPVRILESSGFGRSFDTQIDPRSVRLALRLEF